MKRSSKAEGLDLFEAGAEVVVPHAEGAGVVGTEVVDGVEDETAGAGELGVDAVKREQERAREDVLWMKSTPRRNWS